MIIPLGHEQTSVRRLPWVTFAVMGLCVVISLLTIPGMGSAEREAGERLEEAMGYYVEHPYLEMDPRLQELISDEIGEEQALALGELMRQMGGQPPQSNELLSDEQAEFDRLVDEAFSIVGGSPLHRWGLVPADFHLHALFTHQFFHAGWMHLLGNLFILFLAGPFIEDVWGRPLFASFYLAAGAFAGLMFAVRYPGLDAPLIGASGAIAGVMGAFLVRFWATKIKFFYWFFFFFVGTFEAAAWIMLPLWFLKELFFAQAMDVMVPGGEGGGVAFWAHVWGFAFGAIGAFAISYLRIEERFIHETIESKVTVIDNTSVEDAMERAGTGDSSGAITALAKELRENPDNIDAAMAMWSLCVRHGEPGKATPHMVRAIRRAAQDGDTDFVATHWAEVLSDSNDFTIEPALGTRLAEILISQAQEETASETLRRAWRSVDNSTPAGALLRMSRLAVTLHAPNTDAMIAAALEHPEMPSEAKADLERLRQEAVHPAAEFEDTQVEPEGADPQDSDSEQASNVHTLEVIQAKPVGFTDDSLRIKVDGVTREMSLTQIQALGVGGVVRRDQQPVLVVDLLLDAPWADRETLRIIRLSSDSFDPRRVVDGEDSMEALRTMLSKILQISEAVPLPDPASATGRPFRSFASLDAYHQEVLGVETQDATT
jgi:membrane associated rhomboid family serine protease